MDSFRTHGPLDPVRDKDMFVGRSRELCLIRDYINQGEPYIAIYGARQTGKTSLAYKVSEVLKDTSAFAYINLQPLRGVDSSKCFTFIATEILRQLRDVAAFSSADQCRFESVKDGFDLYQALHLLCSNATVGRITLIFDEVGALSTEVRDRWASVVRSTFVERPARGEFRRLMVIVMGAIEMQDLASMAGVSPLHNVIERIDLEDLSESETMELLQRGFRHSGIELSNDISSYMYRFTAGHPYLTQKLGSEVLRRIKGRLSRDLVDLVVEGLYRSGDPNLRYVIKSLESEDGFLRRRLAAILGKHDRVPFDRSDPIIEKLDLIGVLRKGSDGYCSVRNEIYSRMLARWLHLHDDTVTKPDLSNDYTFAVFPKYQGGRTKAKEQLSPKWRARSTEKRPETRFQAIIRRMASNSD